MERCRTCRWWKAQGSGMNFGFCERHDKSCYFGKPSIWLEPVNTVRIATTAEFGCVHHEAKAGEGGEAPL